MDIDTQENKHKDARFSDPSYKSLLERFEESAESNDYHMCLFLGVYTPHKEQALQEIASATGREIREVDFNSAVVKSEKETYANLDELFQNLEEEDTLLYFKNGDKLCGAYTGFTHSRIKYASPQERYFLNKIKESRAIAIIDITEYTAADKTLRRAAHSIVRFPLPASPIKRFLWHLKNYSFHGFELRTKRPEAYDNPAGI